MEIELRLRDVLVLEDPGERFTETVMSLLGDRAPDSQLPQGVWSLAAARVRRRSRMVLAVTAIAVAAAATMYVMRQPGPPPTALVHDQQKAATPPPARTMFDSQPSDGNAVIVTSPPASAREQARVDTSGTPAMPEGDSAPRILVTTLQHRADDPAARPAAEAFYSSLIQNIRGFGDIVVLEQDATSPADASGSEYRVSVKSLNANLRARATAAAADTDAVGWSLEVKMEVMQFGSDYVAISLDVDSGGTPLAKSCSLNARTAGGPSPVNTRLRFAIRPMRGNCGAAAVAAALAELARPPVATTRATSPTQDQMLKRFLDASLADVERGNTLVQWMSLRQQGQQLKLDAEAAEGIADYIAEKPAEKRREWWQLLGGVDAPALGPAMISVLPSEPDESVRLTLVTMLAITHGDDPGVRKALDLVSRDDASELVRMSAGRGSSGDAAWNEYVVRTLRDTSLPHARRLAPMHHTLQFVDSSSRWADVQAMFAAEENILAVISLIGDSRADPDQSDAPARLLGALNNRSSHPAVLELQLAILKDGSVPARSPLAREAVRGLLKHRQDPRVREILEQILAGDGDAGMRDEIERALAAQAPGAVTPSQEH